ncbi:MAG: carboxypeptidase regulatory-like domain-containing protein [Kofleriaceae bacterium]
MNRKLIVGIVVLAAVVFGVLVLVFGGGGKPATHAPTATARSAEVPATVPAAPETSAPPRTAATDWTLDTDPDGPLQLEGQVVGPDGKGLAGAKVHVSSNPRRDATTEDDGTFKFDKLLGRTYFLSATHGDLIGSARYKLTQTSDPIVIRLAQGASIEVTVVDDANKPIAGAEVIDAERAGSKPEDNTESVKTDSAGKATVKPVRPGYVRVSASATGYAPASSFTSVGSAGATGQITITLHKGFSVSGRVVDSRGKPVANATVSSRSGLWGFNDALDDDVTTATDGKFTIAALAPGSYTLSVVDGEHAPTRSAPVAVTDRPVTGVEITMNDGGLLAGTVVDSAGNPVPFATVRVARSASDAEAGWGVHARQATTDQRGTFELRGLPRAHQRARAESETAASKLAEVDLIEKSELRDVKLVLDVTGTIAGTVVDDTGAPVAEVQVNAFPDILGGESGEGVALAGMSSATTDGGGGFTIRGLPDGKYRLWATRSQVGGSAWGQQGTPAKTGDQSVKITLAAPGSIVGKLALEGSTAPPTYATVHTGWQASTPVNSDGSFRIADVTPGAHDLSFTGPQFAELAKRDVKVEPGKQTDLGTITVTRGRRLVGNVVDRSGSPVAGAKVKVGEMLFELEGAGDAMDTYEQNAGIRSGISDASGAFVIVGIPKNATTAQANHDRGRSEGIAIPAGTEDPPPVTLTLRGFGSITGKVTLKGKPQGGVTVSYAAKGGPAQMNVSKTDDTGTFTFAKVPEGTHVVQVMQQQQMMSLKSTSTTVTVAAGKSTKVNIEIPVGDITLTVAIKAQPNAKVDSAQVFLFSGTVAFDNAKQLTAGFAQGGAQGMKFWYGGATPMPAFAELVPGNYSACALPVTGDLEDPKLNQRIQKHMDAVKVYCKATKVAASPKQQTLVHEVPGMSPLPND